MLKFSNGWLDGFKLRHGIREYKRHGESGSADMKAVVEQRPEIARILAVYEYKDIYNMDETGMYGLTDIRKIY